MARANRPLESVEDLSIRSLQKLQEAGFTTIGSVLGVGLDGLTGIPSMGPKTAEKMLQTLREVLDAPLIEPADEAAETPGEDSSPEEASGSAAEATLPDETMTAAESGRDEEE